MYRRTTVLLQMSALTAGILFTASGARADIDGEYVNSTEWHFNITHVPDFDQKRTVLDNDGKSHCVPTSAINWMAYFANHGRPSINPGPGVWYAPDRYDDASDAIFTMGAFMFTSGTSGTNGSGAHQGYWLWLLGEPVVVVQSFSNGFWSPRLKSAAQNVFSGAYVNVYVGWYDEPAPGFIQRDGGHALTLMNAARSGDSTVLNWCDPASDEGDWTIQSPFTTEGFMVQEQWVMPLNFGIMPRDMDKVVGYGSAYIDSYAAIMPLFAVTSQPMTTVIFTKQAFVLDGSIAPQSMAHGPLPCTEIIDLSILMDHTGYACVVDPDAAQPNQLWIINALTGEDEVVEAALGDPRRVVVGRHRDLYVLDGADLVKINPDVDPIDPLRITPTGEISAMCYDDAMDEVVLIAADTRRLLRYEHHLGSAPREFIIPPGVPLTGRTSLCVNQELECVMFVSDDSDSLWRFTEAAGMPELIVTEYALPSVVEPKAVQVGDDGRVYLSCAEQVVELEYSAKRAGWTPVAEPYFDDVVAGDCLAIARSRSNHDPEIHDTDAWRNVLPSHCTPNGVCESSIMRVQIGDIDQSSSCDASTGYADYTDQFTEIEIGDSAELTVHGVITLPANACGVWVDWDQDLTFDDPRDVVAIGTFNPDTRTFQATVIPPPDAQPGATIMRIRVAGSDAIDPCNEDMQWGETEDYTIVVIEAAPCPWDTTPAGGDGTVGLGDLNSLLSNWGACAPPCAWDYAPEGGDGTVGLGDLNAMLSNWGPCP